MTRGSAFLPGERSSMIGWHDIAALSAMSIAPAEIKVCRETPIARRQP